MLLDNDSVIQQHVLTLTSTTTIKYSDSVTGRVSRIVLILSDWLTGKATLLDACVRMLRRWQANRNFWHCRVNETEFRVLNLLCFFNSYGTPHGANKSAGRLQKTTTLRLENVVFLTCLQLLLILEGNHRGCFMFAVLQVSFWHGWLCWYFLIRALFSKFSICVPH